VQQAIAVPRNPGSFAACRQLGMLGSSAAGYGGRVLRNGRP